MNDYATSERRALVRSIRISPAIRLWATISAKVRRWQARKLETPYERMSAALRQENDHV